MMKVTIECRSGHFKKYGMLLDREVLSVKSIDKSPKIKAFTRRCFKNFKEHTPLEFYVNGVDLLEFYK